MISHKKMEENMENQRKNKKAVLSEKSELSDHEDIVVRDLYELLEKKEHWAFYVCVNGIQDNILAYCNSVYHADGTNSVGVFVDRLYSVEELFDHKVLSYSIGYGSVYVKIAMWDGMKIREKKERRIHVI